MTTPKEMLAIYSTNISASTNGELLSAFISRINSEIPNGVSADTIMNYTNDVLRVYWDMLTTTQYYAFVASTGTPIIAS